MADVSPTEFRVLMRVQRRAPVSPGYLHTLNRVTLSPSQGQGQVFPTWGLRPGWKLELA